MKPRQLTNKELAAVVESGRGTTDTWIEVAARLRGESTASVQESVPRRRFITDDEQKILDTLDGYELNDPETLGNELAALDDPGIVTVSWFLDSIDWRAWNAIYRDCDMVLDDPERFDRCQAAAEDGSDGSTHREIISDWRRALQASSFGPITRMILSFRIDEVEQWHEQNGSID